MDEPPRPASAREEQWRRRWQSSTLTSNASGTRAVAQSARGTSPDEPRQPIHDRRHSETSFNEPPPMSGEWLSPSLAATAKPGGALATLLAKEGHLSASLSEAASEKLKISGLRVMGFSDANGGHTEYSLACEARGKRYEAAHRFSDFLRLHDLLAPTLRLPRAFPITKTVLPVRTDADKRERAEQLADYMASILSAAGDMPPVALCRFRNAPAPSSTRRGLRPAPAAAQCSRRRRPALRQALTAPCLPAESPSPLTRAAMPARPAARSAAARSAAVRRTLTICRPPCRPSVVCSRARLSVRSLPSPLPPPLPAVPSPAAALARRGSRHRRGCRPRIATRRARPSRAARGGSDRGGAAAGRAARTHDRLAEGLCDRTVGGGGRGGGDDPWRVCAVLRALRRRDARHLHRVPVHNRLLRLCVRRARMLLASDGGLGWGVARRVGTRARRLRRRARDGLQGGDVRHDALAAERRLLEWSHRAPLGLLAAVGRGRRRRSERRRRRRRRRWRGDRRWRWRECQGGERRQVAANQAQAQHCRRHRHPRARCPLPRLLRRRLELCGLRAKVTQVPRCPVAGSPRPHQPRRPALAPVRVGLVGARRRRRRWRRRR